MFNDKVILLNILYFCCYNYTIMAKKKNITQNDIISWYMEYVLENNEQPKSVFSFAKHHNFEESLFYELKK